MRPEAHGEIERIYVLRSQQGRGLGRLLMERALAHLGERYGDAPQWIGVWSENLRAQSLYRAYGFEKAGEYIFPLRERGRDVRCLVQGLEGWIADTLSAFNVDGEVREGRIGVWVKQPGRPGGESKIAAIGVRVSKWVTTHGIALNVAPDLTHFDGIVPVDVEVR